MLTYAMDMLLYGQAEGRADRVTIWYTQANPPTTTYTDTCLAGIV